MAENGDNGKEEQARTQAEHGSVRRSSFGRVLVAFAVFAPALAILGAFLLSRGSIESHRFSGSRWPWVVADVALLLGGMRMMKGEDL